MTFVKSYTLPNGKTATVKDSLPQGQHINVDLANGVTTVNSASTKTEIDTAFNRIREITGDLATIANLQAEVAHSDMIHSAALKRIAQFEADSARDRLHIAEQHRTVATLSGDLADAVARDKNNREVLTDIESTNSRLRQQVCRSDERLRNLAVVIVGKGFTVNWKDTIAHLSRS